MPRATDILWIKNRDRTIKEQYNTKAKGRPDYPNTNAIDSDKSTKPHEIVPGPYELYCKEVLDGLPASAHTVDDYSNPPPESIRPCDYI